MQEGVIRRMLSGDRSKSAMRDGLFKYNALNLLKTLSDTYGFPQYDSTFPGKALLIVGSKSDTVVR